MGKVRFTDVNRPVPPNSGDSDLSSRGSDTHTHPYCCGENIPLAVEDEEVRRYRGGRPELVASVAGKSATCCK